MPDLLLLLPTNGHGGCEYGALTVAQFAAHRLGLDVTCAFPFRAETAFLGELCRRAGLDAVDLGIFFEEDDDAARIARQLERGRSLLADLTPGAVFLALPWPVRGTGLISALAEAGIASLVKFALIPETLHNVPEANLPFLQAARTSRQLWFANSRTSAALLERHFRLPARSVEHFHVGPVGLSSLLGETAAGCAMDRSEARRRLVASLALPAAALVATTVGRLAAQKGHATYAEALRLLGPARPALHALWIGEGEARSSLEAAIDREGLAGRVTLAGFRCDVRAVLRGSDLAVFPTLYEGGCSQALLEAMEEGLPIVASRLPGIEEVARDGREALLVAPGDARALAGAIELLAADAELRARLGAAAAARAAHFSRDLMLAETFARLSRVSGRDFLRGAGLPQPKAGIDRGIAASLARFTGMFRVRI